MVDRWAEAIKHAEETGDLSLLAGLLRSEARMDEATRLRIAQMLEDYDLKPIDPDGDDE